MAGRTQTSRVVLRYLLTGIAVFLLFIILIAVAVWITGASESLPFEYEGFD